MEQLTHIIETINGYLFSDYTVYALLATGLIFTIWSGFGQFRALTHGISVVRGKYDDKNDPGAINHFQALSAALSATVGLGNIAGVAVAVALGGPGAILWMWVIGILGMALKMTEVTQSMLYRDTTNPEEPHGGPMFVVKRGFEKWGLGAIGALIGGIFVVTLIISAITGGNMFQAWNVADITFTYFQVDQYVTGIVLTIVVGAVIIGGIKRIGAVAGKIVPLMCVLYILAAGYVIIVHFADIPAMFALIVKSGLPTWLGGSSADPEGAFLGGTFAYAAMWGVKRALFSSEAGQGSSPIAHSAAKTDQPVREGVVAGLEPFIDTIVVCTLTALVILSSGAYNRDAEAVFPESVEVAVQLASEPAAQLPAPPSASFGPEGISLSSVSLPAREPTAAEQEKAQNEGTPAPDWKNGDAVFTYVQLASGERYAITGKVKDAKSDPQVEFAARAKDHAGQAFPAGTSVVSVEPTVYHGAIPKWTLGEATLPLMSPDARDIRQAPEGTSGWRNNETIFMIVRADQNADTGRDLRRITGTVNGSTNQDDNRTQWTVKWNTLDSDMPPILRGLGEGESDMGIYGDYAGASMTAYAFDRVRPGLGKWLVTIAAWLFAVSTMISWSYYGEQGIYYLFSKASTQVTGAAVLIYKLIYCLLILLTTVLAMKVFGPENKAIIGTDTELDTWTTLGLGVMLVANIPIMLIFGAQAMKAYHAYFKAMAAGEDPPHAAPKFTDVVEGKDVE